jgi:hypothetical protein
VGEISVKTGNNARNGGKNSLNRLIRCVCGKKSAQIREILISESAWEEMTCLFAPSLAFFACDMTTYFQLHGPMKKKTTKPLPHDATFRRFLTHRLNSPDFMELHLRQNCVPSVPQ